jgi:hypothetical protein
MLDTRVSRRYIRPMPDHATALKFNVGQWVEVSAHREGAEDLVLIGKITAATRDYAVATCRTRSGNLEFTYSDDTAGHIYFRRMTQADWAARKRARARR